MAFNSIIWMSLASLLRGNPNVCVYDLLKVLYGKNKCHASVGVVTCFDWQIGPGKGGTMFLI